MEKLKIETLQKLCKNSNIVWSVHALERMQEREISKSDVLNVIPLGAISLLIAINNHRPTIKCCLRK